MASDQRVVIGMDPHKRSGTIEVMTADEGVLGSRRFGTDGTGFKAMTEYVKQWPDRVWAIEECNGIGRYVAMRLLAEDQDVVDVPPKLSARTRVSRPARAARPNMWRGCEVAGERLTEASEGSILVSHHVDCSRLARPPVRGTTGQVPSTPGVEAAEHLVVGMACGVAVGVEAGCGAGPFGERRAARGLEPGAGHLVTAPG